MINPNDMCLSDLARNENIVCHLTLISGEKLNYLRFTGYSFDVLDFWGFSTQDNAHMIVRRDQIAIMEVYEVKDGTSCEV